MPGPMSRPDGHKETQEERVRRGLGLLRGIAPRTGKTAKK
jgi:hypothetical protein